MHRLLQSPRTLARRVGLSLLLSGAFGIGTVATAHAAPHCSNCGTVVAASTYEQPAAHGSGLGIATGAVVGGLLGNQVGGGNGRTLATVAGAVGGGYAGNVIEKRVRSTTMTRVRVRMSNGTIRNFTEAGQNRWHTGERVRIVNGRLIAQG